MIKNNKELKNKITALLPMKGHSERVPNKNIRSFAGIPLFHHIADVLQKSTYVDSIVINTDSEIIAREAKSHFSKAKIIERPSLICGDTVPMNEIISYDLSVLEGEHFLQTHSTNPLLTMATLEKAIKEYLSLDTRNDSLFSVTKLQTRLYWENGAPINHDPQKLLRTQDLPPIYEENSNIYLFSRESFKNAGNKRIGLKAKLFVIDALEAMDIDTEDNFTLAEAVYHLKNRNQG